MSQIIQGDSLLIEKGLYQELVKLKTNPKTLQSYKNDLKDFQDKISKANTTETDMQNFLEDRIWFFGLNYIQSHRRSIPKFSSNLGTQYDFLLEGFNQVYDIVEIKGQNDSLFEIDNEGVRNNAADNRSDYKFSRKFSRALHQVMCYLDEFEKQFSHIQNN